MTENTLRIGVVGAGNIATIAQLPTLVARDDIELRALVTRKDDPEPLMRRWGFRGAYPDVEAMLAAEKLDAIFVLTPRSEHVAATRSALTAGVDVFCEKPLATTSADALSLARQAETSRRVLMVGFNRRFAAVYEAGRAAFTARGASFCIAQKNRAGSEYRATFENAIHMVDLLRWYCGGEAVDVAAHAAGEDPWQEDGLSALIRFDNGNTGVLMAARNAGAWGEKLDAYGDGVTAAITAPDRVAITRHNETIVRDMSSEAFGWATATQTFGFAGAVSHFLDRVRDRREPLTSGLEAAKTQVLLERILSVAGLPTEEQPGRAWASHAKK
jgi:virulence factor